MITIDTREPTDEIKKILMENPQHWDINQVNFEAMHLGDYRIDKDGKSLLIERKEMSDLISSIYSKGSSKGSLKQKLFQMQSMSDRAALLIEGTYTLKYGKVYVNPFVPKIPYVAMARFIDHRQNEGIDIIYTTSLEETMFRLNLIMKDKADMSPCKLKTWDQIFMAFPKVGPARLKKLKEEYPEPLKAFYAIEKWLKELDLEKW